MGDHFEPHLLQRFVQKKVGGKTPPQLIFVYPKESVIYRPLALNHAKPDPRFRDVVYGVVFPDTISSWLV